MTLTPSVRITRNRSRGESYSAFEPISQRKKVNSDIGPNLFKILSEASEQLKGSKHSTIIETKWLQKGYEELCHMLEIKDKEINRLKQRINTLESQLKVSPPAEKEREKWAVDPVTGKKIKKRFRKTQEQSNYLMKKFKEKTTWTEEEKEAIGKKIGLSAQVVSKWNWDERKKRGLPTERNH